MPLMELCLVMRTLPRADLATAVKRAGCLLLKAGATVQKLDNLGIDRALPNRFNSKDVSYSKGSYFVYTFDSSPDTFRAIYDEYKRDVDIIRFYVDVVYKDLDTNCTLHEEMNPPAQRKSVLALLEKSKKLKEKTKPFYWHVKEHSFYDPYM